MKKRLMLLTALVLCLFALLVCGSALADMYSVTVSNYAQIRQYCQSFTLFVDSDNFENVASISVDPAVSPSAVIGVRIVPNPDCSVESIQCRDAGGTASPRLLPKDGTVTAYFDLPLSDMTVTVTMNHPEAVTSRIEASFLHCAGTLSDGAQTGSGSLFAEEGSTVTVTAVPEDGYFVSTMFYTTLSDPGVRTIAFTTNGSGMATGSFTMPAEQVYVDVTAIQPPVPTSAITRTAPPSDRRTARPTRCSPAGTRAITTSMGHTTAGMWCRDRSPWAAAPRSA